MAGKKSSAKKGSAKRKQVVEESETSQDLDGFDADSVIRRPSKNQKKKEKKKARVVKKRAKHTPPPSSDDGSSEQTAPASESEEDNDDLCVECFEPLRAGCLRYKTCKAHFECGLAFYR